ncbi:hypothetical protein B566_EDAN016350 [Ephemera danica]|nr:hypothetical protein B566_EDAN016350 [Ephemera danica]
MVDLLYDWVLGCCLARQKCMEQSRTALTKLLVTKLWGKLSQRSDLDQFVIVQDPNELESFFDDITIEVKGFTPVGEDTMYFEQLLQLVVTEWFSSKLHNQLQKVLNTDNEISPVFGKNSCINTFVSGGAKNYRYLVQCGDGSLKSVCKARGLTINSETKKTLNFDTLCNMVLN